MPGIGRSSTSRSLGEFLFDKLLVAFDFFFLRRFGEFRKALVERRDGVIQQFLFLLFVSLLLRLGEKLRGRFTLLVAIGVGENDVLFGSLFAELAGLELVQQVLRLVKLFVGDERICLGKCCRRVVLFPHFCRFGIGGLFQFVDVVEERLYLSVSSKSR